MSGLPREASLIAPIEAIAKEVSGRSLGSGAEGASGAPPGVTAKNVAEIRPLLGRYPVGYLRRRQRT
jgi:hypothetical protein